MIGLSVARSAWQGYGSDLAIALRVAISFMDISPAKLIDKVFAIAYDGFCYVSTNAVICEPVQCGHGVQDGVMMASRKILFLICLGRGSSHPLVLLTSDSTDVEDSETGLALSHFVSKCR